MDDLTFVHLSDLHLDASLAVEWPAGAPEELREAPLAAVRRAIELALRERVDLILFGGDLFEGRVRSVRSRLAFVEELRRLEEAGIPSFLVHGNHDPWSARGGGIAWPQGAHVFGPELEEIVIRAGDGSIRYRVQGVSHAGEAIRDNLSLAFGRRGPEPTFGLLHANLGGQTGHDDYAPCSKDDLDRAGLDYWALGHVHTRAEIALPGGGLAVYPGNTQGRHAGEAGPRGCALGRISSGAFRAASIEWVDLDVVRWHRLTLDLSGLDGLGALLDAAEERIVQACADGGVGRHAPLGHSVRLRLEGRGPAHAELGASPEGLLGFERTVRDRLSKVGGAPICLDEIEDASRPPLALDQLRRSGGLPAGLLELAEEAARDPEVLSRLIAGSGIDDLEVRCTRLGVPLDPSSLLGAASERALALLEDPDG